MILKLNKNNFYPIFLEAVDIEEALVSKNISSGEKNYKYFIV